MTIDAGTGRRPRRRRLHLAAAAGVAVLAGSAVVSLTGAHERLPDGWDSTGMQPLAAAPDHALASADTIAARRTNPTPDEADRLGRTSRSATRLFTLPVPGATISAGFGDRGSSWTFRHTGLDFRAPWGTPAYAVTSGTVVKVAWHKAYGNMVILEVSPGVTLWYCHLQKVLVGPGPVESGQQVGEVGSTGNASGPHLHLEVRVHDRPTDPAVYLFGLPAGRPGAPAHWLPAVPVTTVASLRTRVWTDGVAGPVL